MKLVSLVVLLLLSFAAFAVQYDPPPHHSAGVDLQDIEQPYDTERVDGSIRDSDSSPWYFAVVFYAVGLVGMVAHYTKKWARGEYVGNLWLYLFYDHPRATLAAFITYTGSAAAVLVTGSIDGMNLGQVVALGFLTGYAADSAMNTA